jgi:FkbM family methyltransferase
MKRPFVLRSLPPRASLSLWSRLYRGSPQRWLPLFRSATLRFAPSVKMELVPGDIISDSIALTGIYELGLTRRLTELARIGGLMVEVGANLGYFSLLWAASNPNNACIAFEASPRNTELLRQNIRINDLDGQIRVVPMAVGSSAGKLGFTLGPPDQTGWGGFAAEGEADTIEVDVVRLDEYLDPSTSISFLKIDVEGADTWVLQGCDRLLRDHRVSEIWYEQNKPRMRALGIGIDVAQEFLRSLGYTVSHRSDPTRELVEWCAVLA